MDKETIPLTEGDALKLQLKSNELEVITNPSNVLEYSDSELPKVIYARMLSGRAINKIGLKNMFESIWQRKAGVTIEDYTDGIIILKFESEAVKNRIIRGQPWAFGGSYLILIEADAMTQITAESFQKIPFWVQVHGIPPGLLAKPYGEKLGKEIANSMGEFMEFDPTHQSSFMRFRVGLDSTKALLRGKFLNLDKNKDNIWVSFRYERLSKFCSFCGHINHIQKDCAALLEELERGHNPTLQYTASLKATGLNYSPYQVVRQEQEVNTKQTPVVDDSSQMALKTQIVDSNAKRLKTGITSESVGVAANIKNKKEAVDEAGSGRQSLPKRVQKEGQEDNTPQFKKK
ncbi:uncharacterized protein LOC108227417 isoform X2 [Daucus carota subsp. sativus]|uniref:uncharacterized protein LOC108227417 isoform X2 n=1 Tax=Daucus carota subsp. sativus TaxID=79200 RepID=UPI0007EFA56C|nr:PREDICTED: uncharacterized protein LOC108227417 isoform X2 [Daucus carota subsp. sativus]